MQPMRLLCALFAFPALGLTAALSGCHAVRAMQSVVSGKETVPLPPDDSEKMSATPRRIDAPALLGPESSRVRTGILPPIRFDRDSHLLSKPATDQLRETATWLKGHPERVVIAGGAATGDPEYSRQLAESRAIAVRDFLLGRGVPAGRMVTASYGADGPVPGDSVVFGIVSTGADDSAPRR